MAKHSKPEAQAQSQAEALLKKYDLESNVRVWEGVPAKVIRYLCAAFSLYCIWVTLFSTMMPEEKLNIFLGLVLVIGYLNYPISKKHVRPNTLPWYDILLMILGAPLVPRLYNVEQDVQVLTSRLLVIAGLALPIHSFAHGRDRARTMLSADRKKDHIRVFAGFQRFGKF